MSFSTVYRRFTKLSSGKDSVKNALIQEDSGLQLPNLTLIRSSPLLRQMRVSLSDSWHKLQTWVWHLSILKKILKVAKMSARWIPHLLTEEQKCTRMKMAKQLLKKYPKYQKKVFDSLITSDETLVHFYEPKKKVDNRIWALKHAKGQILLNEHWQQKGVVRHFLQKFWVTYASCCSKR